MTPQERNSLIHDGERLDDLQLNDLQIIQNPKSFCFGIDAVLLSGFVHVNAGARILDLGCGNGILPLLLSAKTKASEIVGLEIRPDAADEARRSVRWNGLEERILIRDGDLREASSLFGCASFSAIVSNPPYLAAGSGLVNPDDAKAVSRHEILCTFEDIVRESALLLKPGGRFFMIHRPQRLTQLLCGMHAYRIEPKRMRMVQPYADQNPTMVLIEGLKDGGAGLAAERPLVIYRKKGVYTDETLNIYRGGAV